MSERKALLEECGKIHTVDYKKREEGCGKNMMRKDGNGR